MHLLVSYIINVLLALRQGSINIDLHAYAAHAEHFRQ